MNATAAEAQPTPVLRADQRAYRTASIDIVRGLVVVLMALDHVRDFVMTSSMQDPTSDPTTGPLLFLTRWVTHLCAPTFVLLAGVSAGLMRQRKSPNELARFLLSRGLWLLFVEVVVISTAWSFAPSGIREFGGHTYVALQVIWAIGASMLALAGAQYLGSGGCLVIGLAIVLGHNLLDPLWPAGSVDGAVKPLWIVLHTRYVLETGPFWIYFSYPLLPWIGVMLVGFAAASLFREPPPQRNPRLIRIGIILLVAFLLGRALDVYGDPHQWHVVPGDFAATIESFLGTTKYPPSLMFLLMTLGPAAILCAFAERLHGKVREVLVTFGRAPFAFYVAHLYLIHAIALLIGVVQGFEAREFLTHYRFFPSGYGVTLGLTYLVWIAVVAMLYPLCRWVEAVKARRTSWWLSFV